MKKLRLLFTLLFATCFICVPMQASFAKGKKAKKKAAKQLERKMKDMLIGAKLSLNLAWIGTNEEDDVLGETSAYPGLGFGLGVDKSLNDYVGLRAEVLYKNKNFTHKSSRNYNVGAEALDSTTYLDYIEIPLMAVVRFNKGATIRPFITFGGYLSFLFMTDGMQKGKSMSEARRPFYGLDGGFVLGAGTYFVLPPGAGFLSLELRYTGGMVNVADENQEFYADNKEEKGKEQLLLEESIYDTNTVSFILGYYF